MRKDNAVGGVPLHWAVVGCRWVNNIVVTPLPLTKDLVVSIRDSLATAYLCWFSNPKADRELYRAIRRNRVRQIVELGIDSIERTQRMIRLASRLSPEGAGSIKYASVDLFDARGAAQQALRLKDAHRMLVSTGASVRLIPGDVLSGLARGANQLNDTDLLIVSSTWAPELLERAWHYVPRMLASSPQIYAATDDGFRSVGREEIERRAHGPTTKLSSSRAA